MTMAVLKNKEWYLSSYALDGIPSSDHLRLRTSEISVADVPEGYIIIQTLLISIDPYLRSRVKGSEDGLYFPQFKHGEVITTAGIGRVVVSKDERFQEGDIVTDHRFSVAEYSVFRASDFRTSDFHSRKVETNPAIPLQEVLGCLGIPGLAAWIAMEQIANPKEGSNVFISAAAGGVGMYAGQLAKIRGCRVIGSVGSNDKVELVKKEFGYNEAFNYNEETDYDAALSKYFPDGIDVYVDNVGGRMLEAVLNHVNPRARIPLCGAMSEYNKVWTERIGVRNLLNAVGKEVRLEGFMLGTYFDKFEEFSTQMGKYLEEGKIKSKHKIYISIDSFLVSLQSLFSSSNTGKVILQVN